MTSSRTKILVVDDDHEVVEVVKIILRTKGYDIDVAYDGEAGLEQLHRGGPYDLVICDLRMPRMSGMEFCRRVRADETVSSTPLLVISSMGSEIDKPESFWNEGLGSDDFLPKPFDPLALLGRVEYLLRKHQYVSHGAPAGNGAGRVTFDPHDSTEVVRAFVESWNSQDFGAEYDTLGEEMLGGLSRTEYMQRRRQLYTEERGDGNRHEALDVTLLRQVGNVATVACLREDTRGGRVDRRDERYTLKRTGAGWKIVNVRSRPLSLSVE